jgi:small subunit ribosomal protein S7
MADEVAAKADVQIASQQAAPKAEAQQAAAPRQRTRTLKGAKQDQQAIPTLQTGPAVKQMLFNKYSYDVEVLDLSLRNQINLRPIAYPTSHGRSSQKSFSKTNMNIIERLENTLMRGGTGGKIGGHVIRTEGRLQGRKIKVTRIIEDAFDMIGKQTGKNPVQVFIRALENSAPIEDTTRVVYGGITSNVAVDVSASRRLDIALRNVAMATIISAFKNKRTLAQALANELILASSMDINSYAIKRKNEIERMARSAK